MTYEEIFITGWYANLFMFLVNFFIALRTMNSKSKEQLFEENRVLSKLKEEFDKYYPYRKYETLFTYIFPFAAFFRMGYRFLEIKYFFDKNEGTTLFDYMTYRYQNDINIAKSRLK